MKSAKIFLFSVFLFFAAMSVFTNAAPNFDLNTTSNNTNQFTYLTNYGFQVTITNGTTDAGNIANATFQLGRPSGSLTNYTNFSSIIVKNNTESVFHVNFTQEQLGGAGTYNYTWFANTSVGSVWNSTQTVGKIVAANTTNQVQLWIMNITNNAVNLNMTGAVNYTGASTTVALTNTTVYLLYSRSGTSNLFYDGVSQNSRNNTNMTLGVGLYKIVGNTSGNENFSSSSRTFYINIGKGTLNLSISGNQTTDSKVSFTTTGSELGNSVEADVNYTLYFNDAVVSLSTAPGSISDIRLAEPGTNTYRFNSTGGANWTQNATGVLTYTIFNVITGGRSGGGSPRVSDERQVIMTPGGREVYIPGAKGKARGLFAAVLGDGNIIDSGIESIGNGIMGIPASVVNFLKSLFGIR